MSSELTGIFYHKMFSLVLTNYSSMMYISAAICYHEHNDNAYAATTIVIINYCFCLYAEKKKCAEL